MSYNDDPNINRRDRIRGAERSNTGMWIAGAVALCLVVGLVAFATTRDTTNTALDTSPATSTATRSAPGTTGSGAATSGTDTPSQPAKPLPNANAPAAPAPR